MGFTHNKFHGFRVVGVGNASFDDASRGRKLAVLSLQDIVTITLLFTYFKKVNNDYEGLL